MIKGSERTAERPRPVRILEVGGHPFFGLVVPQQTESLWAAPKPNPAKIPALGPRKLMRVMGKLRRREFDILVVAASQYAPWHPRSFLTVLRDWHIRAPLGLFAIFAVHIIHRFHDVPVAVLDLSDSCLIHKHTFSLLGACKAYFKRELPSDHWLTFCKSGYPNFPGRRWRSRRRHRAMVDKLKPISFGAPSITFGDLPLPDQIPVPEKTADIFFAGSVDANSTVRIAGLAELDALEKEGYLIDRPMERLSPSNYFKRMAAAWIAWSPGGLGWDCGRHYEAPVVGTVPLINIPTIMRYAPLRDGEHCVLYAPEPGELARVARHALSNKMRLREIARTAGAHVIKHHTSRARAECVLVTVLGKRLDGSDVLDSKAS
jgi:glycosyl transferase family 1